MTGLRRLPRAALAIALAAVLPRSRLRERGMRLFIATMATETNTLVAFRTGKPLQWDGRQMKAVNCPEAERYVRYEFRKGWTL